VCPYGVFEIRRLTVEEKAPLSLIGRLKLFAHGGEQAFAVRADACRACGKCVTACPEHAITLRRR
jgi:4Fe-4S ferredoxin